MAMYNALANVRSQNGHTCFTYIVILVTLNTDRGAAMLATTNATLGYEELVPNVTFL